MSATVEIPIRLDLPIPYESRVKDTFNYFMNKDESVTKFIGYDAILSLFYLYLLKKYKSSCVLYDTTKKDVIVDTALGLALHNTYGVNEDKKRELMALNKINCNRIAKQIISCLKHRTENKVVVLPITLIDYTPEGVRDVYTHNNLLLIRFGTNEIEHYEPHGSMAQILPTIEARREGYEALNAIINDDLIAPLNGLKGDDGTPEFRLIPTMETCPEEEGMQMLETYSKLPKKSYEVGYCAIWTLFVAELALRNHNLTLRELIRIINYDVLQYDKKFKRPIRKLNILGQKMSANDYLRKIARGYVEFVNEKLTIYFSEIFGQHMSLEHIAEMGETNPDAFDELNYRVDGAIFVENIESTQGKKSNEQLLNSLEKEMRKIEAKIEDPLANSRMYKRFYYAAEYVRNREGLDRITPVSLSPSPKVASKPKTPTPLSRASSRASSKSSRSSVSRSSRSSSRRSFAPKISRRIPITYGIASLYRGKARRTRKSKKSRATATLKSRKSPSNYGISKLFVEN